MAIVNRKNGKGWYLAPLIKKNIHIQTIASQFSLKHRDIENIARKLEITPVKYSSEGYCLYTKEDANRIINCLAGKMPIS